MTEPEAEAEAEVEPVPEAEHVPEAEPESREEPQDGRARLLAALRRPASRGQVIAAVLLAILGYAAVVQVRSNDTDNTYVGARQSDLIALINQLSLASHRADNEISQLQKTRDSLRNDTDSRRTAIDRAKQQASTLGILAGTLPAQGPGIRATVTDPTGAIGTNEILNGIEELRDAGAEAMEINNVRVVAQTWIRDGASGGLVVDGQQLSPPYTLNAIGDPHTLKSALNFNGGFTFSVEQKNGKVHIVEDDSVAITAVRPSSAPKYATQAPTQ
ncbi:MAG: DUF881 domain-containing protein [Nocardioidaceae bacterium]